MGKQEEMSQKEIQKKMQEDEDRYFLKEAVKIRHRIELLSAYGFDTLQSIELMKLMMLESIEYALNCEGKTVSESLASIDQTLEDATEVLMDCQVKNQYGSAIAVTGTIQQI